MIGYDYEAGEWVGEESGHREYAYTNLLSVGDDGELSYGHDGSFYVDKFTLNERKALADQMIERWKSWKEELK